MQTDGGAVQQTLTAVWRGMRHLRKCSEGENDLEEVEQEREQFDRLRGRRPLGWIAAGVASRHTAVIYCGTVSPSGLPMWKDGYSPFPMSDIEFSKSDVVFSMSVIEFPMSDIKIRPTNA